MRRHHIAVLSRILISVHIFAGLIPGERAFYHYRNVVGDFQPFVQLVCDENNRRTFLFQVSQESGERLRPGFVETCVRFVSQQ